MEYGEAPARKRRGDVTASAQSRYPDDALSSADHSKTSKELYTMEHSFQRFKGDRWRSESHRTVDILDRRETTCKANKPPDCRFNPSKNYRIYVCDRCHKPKTSQKHAMTFDGQLSSTDHRGCSLQEMEASWRRNEGVWRWWCTRCHHNPGESV